MTEACEANVKYEICLLLVIIKTEFLRSTVFCRLKLLNENQCLIFRFEIRYTCIYFIIAVRIQIHVYVLIICAVF